MAPRRDPDVMDKTLLNPDTGDWATHEVAYSEAVVVDQPGHKRVYCSGVISDAADIEAQTRDVLSQLAETVGAVGGTLDDVVRVRVYIARPHMSEAALETVHTVRREFFDADHDPASTLVEVESLVDDDAMIEIDADAVVPGDGWNVAAESRRS